MYTIFVISALFNADIHMCSVEKSVEQMSPSALQKCQRLALGYVTADLMFNYSLVLKHSAIQVKDETIRTELLTYV